MVSFTPFVNKLMKKSQAWRNRVYDPILKYLADHNIKPHHITILRLILVLPLIYYFLIFSIVDVFITLVIIFLLDTFDGALARKLNSESDRGKFIDILIDQFVYFLTALGLAFWQVVDPIIIGYFILIGIFVYILSIILKQEGKQTDWIIKPQADLTPTKLWGVFITILFAFGVNILNFGFLILNIWYTILFILYFFKLIIKWYK